MATNQSPNQPQPINQRAGWAAAANTPCSRHTRRMAGSPPRTLHVTTFGRPPCSSLPHQRPGKAGTLGCGRWGRLGSGSAAGMSHSRSRLTCSPGAQIALPHTFRTCLSCDCRECLASGSMCPHNMSTADKLRRRAPPHTARTGASCCCIAQKAGTTHHIVSCPVRPWGSPHKSLSSCTHNVQRIAPTRAVRGRPMDPGACPSG